MHPPGFCVLVARTALGAPGVCMCVFEYFVVDPAGYLTSRRTSGSARSEVALKDVVFLVLRSDAFR